MSETEKPVPYITRLETQRDACIRAMKAVDAYEASLDRVDNTAYKADAQKAAHLARKEMLTAFREAKTLLGGIYA